MGAHIGAVKAACTTADTKNTVKLSNLAQHTLARATASPQLQATRVAGQLAAQGQSRSCKIMHSHHLVSSTKTARFSSGVPFHLETGRPS